MLSIFSLAFISVGDVEREIESPGVSMPENEDDDRFDKMDIERLTNNVYRI